MRIVSSSPALPDYPQNTQVAMHFREFLKRGYFVGSEYVQVKFPVGDGSRDILDGTVGICDGFCKILIMVGIILITHHLETWSSLNTKKLIQRVVDFLDGNVRVTSPSLHLRLMSSKELTPQELGLSEVRRRLTSFRWVRCSYTHFTNPAHHYLNALRFLDSDLHGIVWKRWWLWWVEVVVVHGYGIYVLNLHGKPVSSSGIQFTSAEKQSPSPIDFLGRLKESVELERRVSKPGTSRALRDVLSRCVGEYNRMVTQKKHRIDTPTKNLIMNLPLDKFGLPFQFEAI